MMRFALRRGWIAILVALTVSFATYALFNFATDPAAAIAGQEADQAVIDHIRQEYGFDRPVLVQYTDWLANTAEGNFGESYYWHEPVSRLLASHAPITIKLAIGALLVTLLVSLPLGIAAALHPNTFIDRIALTVAVSAQAVPNFWLGLMLIIVFAVIFPIFPVSGDTTWLHFVLPSIVLGSTSVPAVTRLTRTGLLEVMSADYIRTARAKGFRGWRLILRHALRNALLPLVSVLAVQIGHKLGGSVIVETVFGLNGLGRLAVQSIFGSDIPTVEALVMIFAMTFVVLTLLADLINAWLDPRIRLR